MWTLLRQSTSLNVRLIRPYSSSSLSPSELRFKQKLEEADRKRDKNAPEWEKREVSLRKRYGSWNPTRKLSRQQMSDIRDLKAQMPHLKTVQIADFFNINPESIRRILKSKWVPNEEERARQEARAEKRKTEGLERKLADNAQKSAILSSPQVRAFVAKKQTAVAHKAPYKNQYKKHQKHNSENPAQRRNTKPFTEGVGDLID